MSPEIVIAIIALAGSVFGSLIGTKLTGYRIEQLERKVEKQAEWIDRLYKIEQRLEAHEDQLRRMESRLP